MTYPSILMFLDDDARADVRNEQAIRFAQHLGSHVSGLSCHRPVPTGVDMAVAMGGGFADPLTRELQAAQREAVDREQRFLALCDRRQLASFLSEVDESAEAGRALLQRAALHDLVILGQPDPSEDDAARRRAVVDDVVLHSPRPTLLLPYAGRFEHIGSTALVAWDGSHGAARAVADALPLLKRARTVKVVQFDPQAPRSGLIDQSPLRGVVQWLGRHGVQATGEVRYAGMDIGNALLSYTADVGADLLVMGCWGHGRLAERLLGGATRTVMESMTVPVLTSR
jgi:nucleotide-binding universal stress UspA family protein